MGHLIWIVIITAVVVISESKKKQRREQNRVQGQYTQNARRGVNRSVPGNVGMNPNMQKIQQSMNQGVQKVQQEINQNLWRAQQSRQAAQQPGQAGQTSRRTLQQMNQAYQPVRRKADTNSIFDRAEANVRETDGDELKRRRDVAKVKRDAIDAADHAVDVTSQYESSELMRQVNDLMITGSLDTLRYERDFVAEGVEIINSYIRPIDF